MNEKIVQPVVNTTIAPPAPTQAPSPTDVPAEAVVVAKEAEQPKATAESVLKSNIPYQMDPLFHEVASYFNIDPADWDGAKTHLGTIVDYVAQAIDSGDAGDIMLKLREMERGIAPPQFGEKRYTNVYKYVRLAQQRSSIDKAMNAFRSSGQEWRGGF
jgi:hypothetical protein